MALEKIRCIIGLDGNVTIKVEGVKGGECKLLTKELEDALGGERLSEEKTPEYHENVQRTQNIHRAGR